MVCAGAKWIARIYDQFITSDRFETASAMKSHSPGANERLVDTESGHPESLSDRQALTQRRHSRFHVRRGQARVTQ